ncbi:MAG: RnfH family protein [Xanthomonadales bacterium]|jgi:putative ubiquitin-RnfH superfamily antitoxin RatB of RatAB toxin-antitoxin module|nr:RnfH family protein [Xanthomonadales bacterium]
MAHESRPGMIEVEVAYALPARQVLQKILVPEGCTLEGAIDRSGIREEYPDMRIDLSAVGIFGRKTPPGQELREGDRVEIYRPLIADPREARRRRALQKEDPGSA